MKKYKNKCDYYEQYNPLETEKKPRCGCLGCLLKYALKDDTMYYGVDFLLKRIIDCLKKVKKIKKCKIPTTRDYKKTVKERIKNDPDFSIELLNRIISLSIEGELDTARLLLNTFAKTNTTHIKGDL